MKTIRIAYFYSMISMFTYHAILISCEESGQIDLLKLQIELFENTDPNLAKDLKNILPCTVNREGQDQLSLLEDIQYSLKGKSLCSGDSFRKLRKEQDKNPEHNQGISAILYTALLSKDPTLLDDALYMLRGSFWKSLKERLCRYSLCNVLSQDPFFNHR